MRTPSSWEEKFEKWLLPFFEVWGDKRRRKWAPKYLLGLLLPAERKSIAPIASRVAPEDEEQLHHFVCDSPWSTQRLEEVLWEKTNARVGGDDAHLIVDDTALPKKGKHSVGVAHQYCGADSPGERQISTVEPSAIRGSARSCHQGRDSVGTYLSTRVASPGRSLVA